MSSSGIIQFGALALVIAGIEWLFFRKTLRLSFAWVILTPLGVVIGYSIAGALSSSMSYRNGGAYIPFFIWGGVIGLLQAFTLRKSFGRAWLWLLGSAAGFGLPFYISYSSPSLFGSSSNPIGPLILVAGLYSFCTGITFVMMKPRW